MTSAPQHCATLNFCRSMTWIVPNLWWIAAAPAVAAAILSLLGRSRRRIAAALSIAAMAFALALAVAALAATLQSGGERQVFDFEWLNLGASTLPLGWVLDPLTAVMLVTVAFVGLLIFIYSAGYMEHDENFVRFFCFLSLFAGAMLGLVIANSLLLLFMCWELVGLASYLLIGFWYRRPAAAAAAKKAFLTTRIGDIALLVGMVWLSSHAGTLLFYDHGAGCMEAAALLRTATETTAAGMAISTGVGLLIFCGAASKSGQLPLHVWLPDAMEGPTPVSALIHAATMVAAGVFLLARVFPLLTAHLDAGGALSLSLAPTTALTVITWTGASTALFGACVAVAQHDIKRILAYSTISQLGYMMMGLGTGGVAVGMFHLVTHACFKALLFLGAGSVIHGLHGEQDIRRMGGLRRAMPLTFATYAAGMLALSGFPLFFSGFWSKDAILHSAWHWSPSQIPFLLGLAGAFLTAFYMTRQVCYVFFGESRSQTRTPHEGPRSMTVPLLLLAICAVVVGAIGTPAWPWFQAFLGGEQLAFDPRRMIERSLLLLMLLSSTLVFAGLAAGWALYRRTPEIDAPDPLESRWPRVYRALVHALYIDELYRATVVRGTLLAARLCDWIDRRVIGGAVRTVTRAAVVFSHASSLFETQVVNAGFDEGCRGATAGGSLFAKLQSGRVQGYLRWIALALVLLAAGLLWSTRG